jgi:hypothetical protein
MGCLRRLVGGGLMLQAVGGHVPRVALQSCKAPPPRTLVCSYVQWENALGVLRAVSST